MSQATDIFHTKQHWENKTKFLNHDAAVRFLGFYTDDLLRRVDFDQLIQQKISEDQHHNQPSNLKCLDIACGTGLVTFRLHSQLQQAISKLQSSSHPDISVEGIDFSSTMIQGANERLLELSNSSHVPQVLEVSLPKFYEMDGQDLKFPDASFDLIFSNMGVLFYPDIPKGLSEIHRVLKPNGKAFINAWTEDNPSKVPLEIQRKTLSGPLYSLVEAQRFMELCEKAGFSSVSIETVQARFKVPFRNYAELMKSNKDLVKEDEFPQFVQQLAERFGVKNMDEEEIEICTSAHVASLVK
ncbi:hypothetical protein C9374_004986 [Naegleria lovaniensis]|uniref:Methyltransferase type 11 domain-containing protein n=1 Tax=Naegleria lovaniensis TaxID=51637 RepID=A0AA88GPY7_NAELO|nr:uncharacterized protein C9374_004986 [Naegleria lovaniensis]KAG2383019.1 hypothetical protein C9374_004986 [Naegleria lovaniensis]